MRVSKISTNNKNLGLSEQDISCVSCPYRNNTMLDYTLHKRDGFLVVFQYPLGFFWVTTSLRIDIDIFGATIKVNGYQLC